MMLLCEAKTDRRRGQDLIPVPVPILDPVHAQGVGTGHVRDRVLCHVLSRARGQDMHVRGHTIVGATVAVFPDVMIRNLLVV